MIPQLAGIFSPGLDNYDDLLRQPGLPSLPVLMAMGAVMLLVGLYLYLASFMALGRLGKGLAAFRLTRELAEGAIYQRVRNPLSLGYYLLVLAAGLLAGSRMLLCAGALLVIPAHVLYLRFFEEKELECRFGEPYRDYKERVPFLAPR